MLKLKNVWRLLPVLLLAYVFQGMGWAQATGSLVGTVTDKAGAVVANSSVTLTNLGTNEAKTINSDASGNFQFLQLLPGNYSVKVEHTGFEQYRMQSVQVAVGNATRVEAALAVGATTETVEVTTQAPLLSTQSSSLDYGVESKQVEQLPLNGRDVMSLASLVPGVVPQGGTTGTAANGNVNGWGNYQIGGGTGNQSAMYIDGAPINVSYDNSAILVPVQDSVQEFQVATNNVSPEYGRFAGGIMNIATKSGSSQFHGTAYDYIRNTVFNANTWILNHQGSPRAIYDQNQYGAALGGPAIKDKAFFFLSWEQLDLSTQSTTNAYVPLPQMYTGDFSDVTTQLYDPNNATCAAGGAGPGTGTNYCAFTAANGYAGTNQIPASEINQASVNLAKLLFPAATNLTANPYVGGINNYTFSHVVPKVVDTNQWNARGDENIGSKNKLFERFTDWHKNAFGASNYGPTNFVGNRGYFGADQAVLGDTITITPSLIADVRLSFLRFVDTGIPLSCCKFDYGTQVGSGWANIQSGVTYPELPEPNVSGLINFSGGAIILETDNAYVLSGAFTKMLGRHTIEFGGEARKIEWDYAQSNSAGSTFTFGSGYSSSCVSCGTAKSTGGWGFASMLLGYPTQAQTAEPALSKGVMWYSGLYASDSFRFTPKLTINAGVRWEQPGSFTESHGRLTTMLLNLPQPAVSQALGKTVTGGLALINSSAYPHSTWQELNWKAFSPRVGVAYSPTDKWVFRGGFGVSYLPPTVSFSLGPYNSPVNLATTTESSAGATPNISMTNPFPNGVAAPAVGQSALQGILNGLLGSGIQSPLASQPSAYEMQWNIGFQKQLGSSASINVGYVGAKGVHLPLYSVNYDQLPDQYDICGTDSTQSQCLYAVDGKQHLLSDLVSNPMSAANGGPIPVSAGTLGAANIPYGYLLKPYPQYLYMSADSPNIGFTFYQALQVMAQKRFRSGGILSAAWTFSNLTGTADTLNAWLEASRYDVGGGEGIQDNDNINGNASNPGEKSIASFQTPNRVVVNYVYPLPFGHGQRFLSDATGVVDKLVGGWTVNGLTTFQSGFPLAFQNSSPNTLENLYAEGYAGPGLGAGVSRPNYVPNAPATVNPTTGAIISPACNSNPRLGGSPSSRINAWFKTSCFQAPTAYQWGNEPRVDPNLRGQGIDTTDFSAAKDIALGERYKLDFRAEFFNIFNWTQFSVPTDTVDTASTFGKVTAQYNQPRLIQFSGRFTF